LPDAFFEGVVGLMRDPMFLALANFWNTLLLHDDQLELISVHEK